MKIAHKALLATLARRHAQETRVALQLAIASFEQDHPTVERLRKADRFARETAEVIESEPAQRAVAA